MKNGIKSLSTILVAFLFASCATAPTKLDEGVVLYGTPKFYRQQWDELDRKEGKASKERKRLFTNILNTLTQTQGDLAYERGKVK